MAPPIREPGNQRRTRTQSRIRQPRGKSAMHLNQPSSSNREPGLLRRPVGRLGLATLTLLIAVAPAVLFFDPVNIGPGRGHVAREPMAFYRLFSDDVAYVASSRNWQRTVSHLFVPHNTHIVPAWRIVTWALVACSGNLERLPRVLAVASYSILVAVMLMTGRLVARETGRTILGLGSMVLVGTTSLMLTPATWYSASQPLWAGLVILVTLWYAQCYRRSGRWPALVLAALTAPIAGWFWTLGHLAGPSAAVYLWVDGRRRCKLAALVPLAATILAVTFSLTMAASQIDSTTSFHGRTVREALHPLQGLLHTGQSIPENLVFANLGLTVLTTQSQGAVLSLALFVLWSSRWWRWRLRSTKSVDGSDEFGSMPRPPPRFNPLEWTGAAMIIGGYLMEWSFRGYLEYQFLRTINARFLVPWYDAVPQIGAVLLVAGWWSAAHAGEPGRRLIATPTPLSWTGGLGLGLLVALLIVTHRPRVDALTKASMPPLLPSEVPKFISQRHLTIRANSLQSLEADWQRSYLRRLDRAEVLARRTGWSRDAIRTALGHPWVPGTVGLLRPDLYDLYDAIGLLNVPEHGPPVEPETIRGALAELFAWEKEPRPNWLAPNDPWPPPADAN